MNLINTAVIARRNVEAIPGTGNRNFKVNSGLDSRIASSSFVVLAMTRKSIYCVLMITSSSSQ